MLYCTAGWQAQAQERAGAAAGWARGARDGGGGAAAEEDVYVRLKGGGEGEEGWGREGLRCMMVAVEPLLKKTYM